MKNRLQVSQTNVMGMDMNRQICRLCVHFTLRVRKTDLTTTTVIWVTCMEGQMASSPTYPELGYLFIVFLREGEIGHGNIIFPSYSNHKSCKPMFILFEALQNLIRSPLNGI
jgi:hypothetical protein